MSQYIWLKIQVDLGCSHFKIPNDFFEYSEARILIWCVIYTGEHFKKGTFFFTYSLR